MKKHAFTLAELLIVLLVITVIMAATAPIITKRRKAPSNTSPWRWATNKVDAYFGQTETQTAMIGQAAKTSDDSTQSAKLIINTGSSAIKSHILFKQGTNYLAKLTVDASHNFLFNNGSKTSGGMTGAHSTAMGYQTLYSDSSGDYNTAIGCQALYSNTEGFANTANGYQALYKNTTGYGNTANGYQALYKNTTGDSNIANGAFALHYNTTGSYNIANGAAALYSNTTGDYNIANGDALGSNTTGDSNIANGAFALASNTTGSHNIANGHQALYSNTTGDYNIANGAFALESNTTGSYNIANGAYALYSNTTGDYNIANGAFALGVNTTGNYNVAIGYSAQSGNYSYSTAIGYQAAANGNHQVVIGTESETVYIRGTQYQTSDKRLKNIKDAYTAGLDAIRQLNVFNYTFKDDKLKNPRVGVIAQDVQKVLPSAVKKEQNGYLSVKQENILYTMLNAIKELDKSIKSLEKKIETLIAQQQENAKRIDHIENQIKNMSLGVSADTKLHCLGSVCVVGK